MIKKIAKIFKDVDWSTVKPAVIARYILMIIALINLILKSVGALPVEVDESVVYNVVSIIFDVVVIVMNTYKNNSTSKEAIISDSIMIALKESAELPEGASLLRQIDQVLTAVKEGTVVVSQ